MTNPNEIDALKAAMRGARQTAGALSEIGDRVEALDPRAEVADADLDDLQRVAAAHALAAQALRGLVATMRARRGNAAPAASAAQSVGEDE
jgi:hypothetical protein